MRKLRFAKFCGYTYNTLPRPIKYEFPVISLIIFLISCHSGSPAKTPSKFLAVGMLASPVVTPSKLTDTQAATELSLSLDATDFVDHQVCVWS